MDYVYIPYDVLDKIAKHCPEALETYLHVFMDMDIETGEYKADRELVVDQYGLSFTKFCNNLRDLMREDILKVKKKENEVFVTVAVDG